MNIEVYEAKVKSRLFDKTDDSRDKKNKKEIAKENKEAVEKETRNARLLCAEYHRKLDGTTYFDTEAMRLAKELLPKFNKLKKELLPQSVAKVVEHRTIYLNMMVYLSKNLKVGRFLDRFAPSFTDMGLFSADLKDKEEEVLSSKEFQAFKAKDFEYIRKVLLKAKRDLQPLLKGNFAAAARKYLKDSSAKIIDIRVDDGKAANNLENGITTLLRNFRTWSVFQLKEAPKMKKGAKNS